MYHVDINHWELRWLILTMANSERLLLTTELGWPIETAELQKHRINFFSKFNVCLDVTSDLSFDEQLRANETPYSYSMDFLSQQTHKNYIDTLQRKKDRNSSSSTQAPPIDKNPLLLHEIEKNGYVLSDETDEDGGPVLMRKAIRTNRNGKPEMRLLMVFHSGTAFESLKAVHYDMTTHGNAANIVCQFNSLGVFMSTEVAFKFTSACPRCTRFRIISKEN